MLVSELITWCNSLYERGVTEGSETISDTLWMMYFNDAQIDISSFLKFQDITVTDLVEDQNTYGLPSDFLKMKSVWDYTSGTYTEIDPVDYDRLSDYTSEKRYSIWEDNIILSWTVEDVTDGLKLYYYKQVAELTATTDTIEIKDPYALGYYALSSAEIGDRATGQSGYYYSMYTMRKDNLKVNPTKVKNRMWS